jgi:hypothetical protein
VGALEGSAGHIVKRLLGGWSLPGVAYIEVGGRLTGGRGAARGGGARSRMMLLGVFHGAVVRWVVLGGQRIGYRAQHCAKQTCGPKDQFMVWHRSFAGYFGIGFYLG